MPLIANHLRRRLAAALVLSASVLLTREATAKPLTYTGVSIAGGDFGTVSPGSLGVYGTDYIYPSADEIAYYSAKGMNLVRLPVFWERLQPKAGEPLDAVEMARIAVPIREATRRRMIVLLDVHNYDRYYGQTVGESDVPVSALVDFWTRLAGVYKGNRRVWFGLMNEPHDMKTENWADQANQCIAAIRKEGAHNFILVSGNGWDGAPQWNLTWYGTPNATVMLGITDPDDNYGFEAHAYFDPNNAGKDDSVKNPTVGADRMKVFTDWCRQNHKRAFLGEFGTGGTDADREATQNLMTYMEANADVVIGFAYWAGGSLWGDNPLSIEPAGGKDKPQMGFIAGHLHGSGRVPADPPRLRKDLPAVGSDAGTAEAASAAADPSQAVEGSAGAAANRQP